jgi:hypothetical protein
MKIAPTEADPAAATNKLTKVAAAAGERGVDAAREGLQVAQRSAGAASELQRATIQQSVKGASELGQLAVKLFNEQMRHNLNLATALARTADLGEMIQVQNEFVRASFERMSRLNSRYLEILQAGMRSMVFTART